MSNRYENVPNVVTDSNITRKRLMYNIPINVDNLDEFIIISNPNRISYNLAKLAQQYYGDGKYWWIIAKANSAKHPHNFTEESILIPKDLSKIVSNTR